MLLSGSAQDNKALRMEVVRSGYNIEPAQGVGGHGAHFPFCLPNCAEEGSPAAFAGSSIVTFVIMVVSECSASGSDFARSSADRNAVRRRT